MEHLLTRLATQGDLAGLAALYAQLRPNDPPLVGPAFELLLGQLAENPNVRLLVGELNSVLVSTCMLGIIQNLAQGGKPFGVIEHVVTLSSHQKQGHGREVLSRALDYAWQANCYKVMLLSGAKLSAAHSVYESLGFAGDVERGFVAKPKP